MRANPARVSKFNSGVTFKVLNSTGRDCSSQSSYVCATVYYKGAESVDDVTRYQLVGARERLGRGPRAAIFTLHRPRAHGQPRHHLPRALTATASRGHAADTQTDRQTHP